MLKPNPRKNYKIKDLPKIERSREKHKGEGHRRRLREKFLRSG